MKKITLILSSIVFSIFGLTYGYALEIEQNLNTWENSSENNIILLNSEIFTFEVSDSFMQPKDFSHFYDIHTETLVLTSPNSPFSDVMIYNVLGQEVLIQKLSGRSETLDLSGLVNGLYIVKVNLDKDSKIIKVLKQ